MISEATSVGGLSAGYDPECIGKAQKAGTRIRTYVAMYVCTKKSVPKLDKLSLAGLFSL